MKEKLFKTIQSFKYEETPRKLKHTKDGAMEYYKIIFDENNFLVFSCSPDIRNQVLGKIGFFSLEYGTAILPIYSIELDHSETEEYKVFFKSKIEITHNLISIENKNYVDNFLNKL